MIKEIFVKTLSLETNVYDDGAIWLKNQYKNIYKNI